MNICGRCLAPRVERQKRTEECYGQRRNLYHLTIWAEINIAAHIGLLYYQVSTIKTGFILCFIGQLGHIAAGLSIEILSHIATTLVGISITPCSFFDFAQKGI
jgi:hypothetical protein